jgi:ribosomal-protein-alanine N-acetyltransferase
MAEHILADRSETGLHRTVPSRAVLQQWRDLSPVLCGRGLVLREPRVSDAPTLFATLSSDEVGRFIASPPSTVEGFEQFIMWTHEQRAAGESVCFALVPQGADRPVGLFQVRRAEPDFSIAEWGFILGASFWGNGTFFAAAPLVIDFAFEVLGVLRLEARAAVLNGRGNNALRKLGAVQEALLRKSLDRSGDYLDQVLWSIVAEDWRSLRPVQDLRVH